MNPFDLAGPQFLLFYVVVAVVALVLMVRRRRAAERGGGKITLSDPYLIAYLRGGSNEALRVATISLVDRGLLEMKDDNELKAKASKVAQASHALETAVLEHFEKTQSAISLYKNLALQGVADRELGDTLRKHGLLPDAQVARQRKGRLVMVVVLLWILAFIKVMLALSRGRTNVGFLVVLAILSGIVALAIHNPRRTARGESLLQDLRGLFSHLKQRASGLRTGGATAEMALLAAVFGLGALPASGDWAFTRSLFPRASTSTTSSSTSCGSNCGSSCGSSSSSSSDSSGSSDSSSSSCGGGGGCGGCGGGGGD